MGKEVVQDDYCHLWKNNMKTIVIWSFLGLKNTQYKLRANTFQTCIFFLYPVSSRYVQKVPANLIYREQDGHWPHWLVGPAMSTLNHWGVSIKADPTRVIFLATVFWVSSSLDKPSWVWAMIMAETRMTRIICSAKLCQFAFKTIGRDGKIGRLSKHRGCAPIPVLGKQKLADP